MTLRLALRCRVALGPQASAAVTLERAFTIKATAGVTSLSRSFASPPLAPPRTPNCLRQSSSWSSPASLDWAAMTSTQRAAWQQLGWVERSWDGHADPPPSDAALWAALSPAEQAAAQHGLGYSAQTWDSELLGLECGQSPRGGSSSSTVAPTHDPSVAIQSDRSSSVASAAPERRSTGLLSSLFSAVRSGSDLVETGFDLRKDPLGGLMDLASGGAVTVDQTEAIVYLDDSGSMASHRNLAEAHAAFDGFAPLLGGTPTRVVLFGSHKSEVVGRTDKLDPRAVKESWQGSSGKRAPNQKKTQKTLF